MKEFDQNSNKVQLKHSVKGDCLLINQEYIFSSDKTLSDVKLITQRFKFKTIILHNINVQTDFLFKIIQCIDNKEQILTFEFNNVTFQEPQVRKFNGHEFPDELRTEFPDVIMNSVITSFSFLKNIQIVNTNVSIKTLQCLAEYLMQEERRLETLDLSFSQMVEKQVTILSWLVEKDLVNNLSLRSVGLSNGSIGRLCASLCKTKTLLAIDLSENNLSDLDLSLLFQSCQQSDILQKMILNNLPQKQSNTLWTPFAKQLSKTTALKHLEIKAIKSDSDGQRLILNSIFNNKSLKVIKVLGSTTPYPQMVWSALCELLQKRNNLNQIDISHSSFDCKNFSLSKLRMNDRSKLLQVNIRCCPREFAHQIACFESRNVKFIHDNNVSLQANPQVETYDSNHQELVRDPSQVLKDLIKEKTKADLDVHTDRSLISVSPDKSHAQLLRGQDARDNLDAVHSEIQNRKPSKMRSEDDDVCSVKMLAHEPVNSFRSYLQDSKKNSIQYKDDFNYESNTSNQNQYLSNNNQFNQDLNMSNERKVSNEQIESKQSSYVTKKQSNSSSKKTNKKYSEENQNEEPEGQSRSHSARLKDLSKKIKSFTVDLNEYSSDKQFKSITNSNKKLNERQNLDTSFKKESTDDVSKTQSTNHTLQDNKYHNNSNDNLDQIQDNFTKKFSDQQDKFENEIEDSIHFDRESRQNRINSKPELKVEKKNNMSALCQSMISQRGLNSSRSGSNVKNNKISLNLEPGVFQQEFDTQRSNTNKLKKLDLSADKPLMSINSRMKNFNNNRQAQLGQVIQKKIVEREMKDTQFEEFIKNNKQRGKSPTNFNSSSISKGSSIKKTVTSQANSKTKIRKFEDDITNSNRSFSANKTNILNKSNNTSTVTLKLKF